MSWLYPQQPTNKCLDIWSIGRRFVFHWNKSFVFRATIHTHIHTLAATMLESRTSFPLVRSCKVSPVDTAIVCEWVLLDESNGLRESVCLSVVRTKDTTPRAKFASHNLCHTHAQHNEIQSSSSSSLLPFATTRSIVCDNNNLYDHQQQKTSSTTTTTAAQQQQDP